jgi:hypothetical protein
MYVFNGGFRVVPLPLSVGGRLFVPSILTARELAGAVCCTQLGWQATPTQWHSVDLATGSGLGFLTASQAPASAPSHSWLPVSASSNQTSIIKLMRDELPA